MEFTRDENGVEQVPGLEFGTTAHSDDPRPRDPRTASSYLEVEDVLPHAFQDAYSAYKFLWNQVELILSLYLPPQALEAVRAVYKLCDDPETTSYVYVGSSLCATLRIFGIGRGFKTCQTIRDTPRGPEVLAYHGVLYEERTLIPIVVDERMPDWGLEREQG